MAWTYIMTNRWRTTLYIGATEDLVTRVAQHKAGKIPGFTKRYNVSCLVYAEMLQDIENARSREKTLKGWRRSKKERLIAKINPGWKELQVAEFTTE